MDNHINHSLKIKLLPFLGLLTLLLYQNINAQNEFEPGYVILNSNDTIYGQIKDRNDSDLLNKLKLRQQNKKTKRFSANDIKRYKKGTQYFESLWYKEEAEFFKIDYYSQENYEKKYF